VLDALRLGAHQALGTRVPPHAVVSTTVELVRRAASEGAARLANAVTRKVIQHDLEGWTRRLAPDPGVDPIGQLAFRHAHPAWIVRALRDVLPGGLAELDACLAADNVAAPTHLVVRPGRATVDELVAAGATAASWSPYGAVLASGRPADIPA